MEAPTSARGRARRRAEAEERSADYRSGYPDAPKSSASRDIWNFYNNKIKSEPRGDFIDVMLVEWKGNYELLERHHGFIQWLFPLREAGINWQASVMSAKEAQQIAASEACRHRLVQAYRLMLDFYGFRLVDEATGALEPAENFSSRIAFLNVSGHNYLRISRILKSLGELGFEHYKAPWIKMLIMLCFNGDKPPLRRAQAACEFHWVYTLKNEAERLELLGLIDSLVKPA
ncbi:hypothetical protein BOX15_Mlig021547g2 [Macrostomum lignano]|uniref:Opioid growth factor receptor (OGFr) conserved domain-containing protein n=1 Tax=Macrostomum lignano TaxID=282301 RepID=A0A267GIS1_9PLAT|nr:hypothetical protein BOX15_Mlig021547g2 [Macrostomum lignano]